MRSFKQICACLLALALAFSIAAPGAAAAEQGERFTDMGQVVHREAVSLMVDLGVLQGVGDGKFAPQDTVDRASMAKMLYGIMMGSANTEVFVTMNTGLTDVSSSWAAAYINYCYSVGIVSGQGDGKFDPEGTVSVASAAKMLLVALGYDAKDRRYEGDSLWSDNIMRDARDLGLLEGVTQQSFEALTRDNAAQMLYNALFTSIRVPHYILNTNGKVISGYDIRPTTLGIETYGLVKILITVGDVTTRPSELGLTYAGTLPTAKFIRDEANIMGLISSGKAGIELGAEYAASRVAVYVRAEYELDQENSRIERLVLKEMLSSLVGTASIATLGTSTNGTDIVSEDLLTADLTTKRADNPAFLAELDSSAAYFINGRRTDQNTANTAARLRGAIVALLDANQNGKADMVKITVKTVSALVSDAEVRNDGGVVQVKAPGVPTLANWTEATHVMGYAGLKEGDVVLTALVGKSVYIERAEVISGTVSSVQDDENGYALIIDGEAYTASGLAGYDPIAGWSDFSGKYWFYLDDNGSIALVTKAAQ